MYNSKQIKSKTLAHSDGICIMDIYEKGDSICVKWRDDGDYHCHTSHIMYALNEQGRLVTAFPVRSELRYIDDFSPCSREWTAVSQKCMCE